MKVQRLQKMQLKKATISRINQATATLVKGGTRGSETTGFDDSALMTQCGDIVCW